MALLSAGAIAILIGLDLANADGFTSPLILALLAGGVALLAVFLLAERRLGKRALVPADVLRNRVFAASCGTVLLMVAGFAVALGFVRGPRASPPHAAAPAAHHRAQAAPRRGRPGPGAAGPAQRDIVTM